METKVNPVRISVALMTTSMTSALDCALAAFNVGATFDTALFRSSASKEAVPTYAGTLRATASYRTKTSSSSSEPLSLSLSLFSSSSLCREGKEDIVVVVVRIVVDTTRIGRFVRRRKRRPKKAPPPLSRESGGRGRGRGRAELHAMDDDGRVQRAKARVCCEETR